MWWAFDVEAEGFDTFACAAAVSTAGDRLVFRHVDRVRDWYRSLDASDIVWSHGGGGYDFLLLVGIEEDRSWQGRTGGGSLLSCRAHGGADCRDSMALFPLKLSDWTGKKMRLDLPCSCGEPGCEGYCSIRARGMPRALMRRLIERCVSDCEILLEALVRDIARLRALGLDVDYQDRPRLTMGSIAWKTAARLAGIDATRSLEWGEYDAGMRARYGGRCEVGQVSAPSGERYDLRMAYPAALTLPVPCGTRRALFGLSASRAYQRGAAGCFHALVYVPEGLPLVPHRRRFGGRGRGKAGKLLWTTGWLDDWWVREELHALEAYGGRILKIDAAHVWSDEEPLYEPFVDLMWQARAAAQRSGDRAWETICKLGANSLSGKLQQGPERDVLKVQARGDDPPLGWHWHGGRVWSQRLRHVPACARPIEAAVMLARTRVRVLDRMIEHPDTWLYTDTDSFYLTERDDRGVGPGLGEWKYEGSLTRWMALAPKLVRYVDHNGEEQVRARGIPRATWETLDQLARGVTVSRRGVARIRASEGRLKGIEIRRAWGDVNEGWAGMRRVEVNGRTRALHRREEGDYV